MVLDPLSALGLAANVIQFIEFGSKLVSKSVEQYNSIAGSAANKQDVELVARHVNRLSEDIVGKITAKGTFSRNEDALKQLAQSCAQAASELIGILESLKLETGTKGPKRMMQSLRQAFRSMGQESRIEAFERKLDYFRSELTLNLVMLTHDQGSSFQVELRQLHKSVAELNSNQEDRLNQLLGVLKPLMAHRAGNPFSVQELPAVRGWLSAAASAASEVSREQAVLSSLHF
ncbi:MAG: hypothetical protein Q9157_006872 [Trypethelium eluteriae]